MLTKMAFSESIGGIGPVLVAVGLAFFAFSTVLGWAYYGERNLEYLFGRVAVTPYRSVFIAAIFVGTVRELESLFLISDLMNGLMALPNLIGLILLSGVVARETRDYFRRAGRQV
ncbi:alanine:cation symporter family protein [Rubrobacter xylanophilus]|uniref:alanine:cation symporter family protein n=1 Tax=Rubrobacter xylanophilus TaxID=49319 RepID=UPI001C63E106|nr:alanine:cation symporter family protein [Rubrobacter xylanophilus]